MDLFRPVLVDHTNVPSASSNIKSPSPVNFNVALTSTGWSRLADQTSCGAFIRGQNPRSSPRGPESDRRRRRAARSSTSLIIVVELYWRRFCSSCSSNRRGRRGAVQSVDLTALPDGRDIGWGIMRSSFETGLMRTGFDIGWGWTESRRQKGTGLEEALRRPWISLTYILGFLRKTFETVDPRMSQKLMMDQHSLLCCAAILLLFFASPIGSSSLIANTNVSTSWINNPSRSDTPFLSVNFKPILSTGNRFSCGFYCDIYHPKTACLLAVVIYAEESAEESIGSTMSYSLPQLVWSANRNHPVKRNATLQLTRDGDLVLADADGTFVWSTNTSGKYVSGLDLTEHGNLVLFDRNNTAIWQSFDHPTDCLVLGQTLVRGRKLIANISPSNWSEGLYSLLATRRELHAYIETNTPLTYYQGPKGSPKYENGSFSRFTFPFVLGAQFMRLESDGRLKVYEYRRYDWKVVADDLLTESGGECGYPMMCGKYGICSKGECVGCPDEANSKERNFRHVSYTQPNLGCSPVTPISCDQSQYHTLLELQNTSYFGFIPPNCDYYRNETTWHEEAEVEDCKKSCLSNCSCKAVLSVAAAYNSKPVLEMLCGRKNLDRSQPEEEMHLLGLFQKKGEEGQLLDMVDKYNADMQLHEAEVVEMMKVAVWCLQSDYQRRPSMTVVVQVLEGFVTVPDQLGYNFINAPARRTMEATGGDMDAIDDDGTPLLASVLSGPR
ncbi:hypothetical protein Vadar_024139 [Vaccinium darrowii]|uniref:Uncharacterized protein n=1 Tax=Vaccinium darrowii TaxID=229202 RepID=A0ACB7Z5T3_9ERIC|nr:hypothetical protein Vadar_024139 [Vaccinium darrowii]